ncbi:hypothetical protein V1289_002034 [Bradyrhizobium sp. AZCC 2289]
MSTTDDGDDIDLPAPAQTTPSRPERQPIRQTGMSV